MTSRATHVALPDGSEVQVLLGREVVPAGRTPAGLRSAPGAASRAATSSRSRVPGPAPAEGPGRPSPPRTAASAVVSGTAATRPMEPQRVRAISTAISSELATMPHDWSDTANSQQQRHGSAHVGQQEGVDRGGDVCPADAQSGGDEPAGRQCVGSARRSSATVAACVIVTSSRAPSAPIMAPASSSDERSMPPETNDRMAPSSVATPVKRAAPKNRAEMPSVSPRDPSVPARAMVVSGFGPVGQVEAGEGDHRGRHDSDQQRLVAVQDRRRHESHQHQAPSAPSRSVTAGPGTDPAPARRRRTPPPAPTA